MKKFFNDEKRKIIKEDFSKIQKRIKRSPFFYVNIDKKGRFMLY